MITTTQSNKGMFYYDVIHQTSPMHSSFELYPTEFNRANSQVSEHRIAT